MKSVLQFLGSLAVVILILSINNKKTENNWMTKDTPEIVSAKLEKLGYTKLKGETCESHVKREMQLADMSAAGY